MSAKTTLLVPLLLALILAACAAPTIDAVTTEPTSAPSSTPTAASTAVGEEDRAAGVDLTRTDEQGAVAVVVIPLNLASPTETLDFEIALNTHSVDLSMDLTALAILSADTGVSVAPTAWDGSSGGHHVSGILSFPMAVGGTPVLQNATRLTLTIRDVDAPERTFVWELEG